MNRRTRVILFSGVMLLILGVAVIGIPAMRGGKSLLSPGLLASPHADYEGEEGCQKCHVPGEGLSENLCLDCHEPLAARIAEEAGFHAKVEGKCWDCHADHLGLEYDMIRWPTPQDVLVPTQAGKATRDDFDHEAATGLPLTGAHELACDKCHKLSLIIDPALMSFKKEHETYLGLGTDCSACHLNPHVPSQGNKCGDCHSDDAWTPTPKFDHADTRYPLEGKHAKVECKECHLSEALAELPKAPDPPVPTYEPIPPKDQPALFRGVGFGKAPAIPVAGEVLPTCINCHENPHKSTKGDASQFLSCADCHTPHDWKQADSATFDHGTTGWPLEGGHLTKAKCADCHGKALNEPAPTSCLDCHEKDDHHKGGFEREMTLARQSCEMCHTAEDWKQDTYAKRQHPLPLIEGHGVSCEKCHGSEATYPRLPARPPAKTGPLEEACAACHDDPHKARLGNDCVDCHGFEKWHLAKLDAKGHEELGFPLVDAHLTKADCKGCHGGRNAEGGLRRMALAEVRVEGCVACHEDEHAGQLSTKCADCHNEKVFDPSLYTAKRHQKARMPLEGAHRAVPCEVCHERDLPGTKQRFRWERQARCNACHKTDDPHRGQFSKDCDACHKTQRWLPSTFTVAAHAKVGFPLEQAHDVACDKCHVTGLRHGKAVTYEGTPSGCAGCHEDVHAGQFARRRGGCKKCHTLEAWKPTTFDHDACRYPLAGKHTDLACSACHLSSKRKARDVVHYYPIEARECDDCHVNPHALGPEPKKREEDKK